MTENYENEFTEVDAAFVYAHAVNRLDPSDLIALLAPDAIYRSFQARQPLEGKEAIAEYISNIMANQRNVGMQLKAEVVWIFEDIEYLELAIDKGLWTHVRDGVLLKQDGDQDHDRLVIFGVEGNLIKRIDILWPYGDKLCFAIRK